MVSFKTLLYTFFLLKPVSALLFLFYCGPTVCTLKSLLFLTLIRESWKKIQNAGPSPSVFCGKNIQSAALNQFVYVSVLWIFFPEITLGDGPKKWHIFFFSAAYFPSYWHMPFEISIIR